MKTRIAPSPTGDPHVGTAYQALFNFVFAKQNNGKFIVRLEDTDRNRLVEGSGQKIMDMLDWLGLPPDESPSLGGPSAPYVQSERVEKHQAYAQELLKNGSAYRAFDTPEELLVRREANIARGDSYRGYDRRDRDILPAESDARAANGENFVVRLKAPLTGEVIVQDLLRGSVVFKASELDDKVLLKADGFPTYHLAAMTDDHDMGITHVIRAEEWLTSTPIHVLILRAFGWPEPIWIHTPWLLNAKKKKLSKRHDDASVESYKAKGIAPEALLNYLGMMGWTMPNGNEIFTVQDMIEHFSWERISLGGSEFNWDKLSWLNGKYIREVFSLDDVVTRAEPFFKNAGFDTSDKEKLARVVAALRRRFDTFAELPYKAEYFFKEPVNDEKAAAKILDGKIHLAEILKIIETNPWDVHALELSFKTYAESAGAKLGAVMQPLRAALTGRLESPGMFEVLEALGRETVLARLNKAVAG